VRIAIVSDIHGNRTAFEAVLADLRQTAPDLVLHGGDLADSGSSPVEIIDRIRDLGWPGVVGNTDEMLFDPQSLTRFAAPLPQLQPMFAAIEEMAATTREALGDERLAWLRDMPRVQIHPPLALVHATSASLWKAPMVGAADADLEAAYAPLGQPTVVYGHIHQPYIRTLPGLTVANSGSVGQSHDGDPRASYLLVESGEPSIRRVEYDVEREIRALNESRLPHAGWIAVILQSARPQALN
jgi:predicted phosphodiesterase